MTINFSGKKLLNISILIAALISGMAICLLTNVYGAGLSPDSIYYISVARHLSDGKGFIGYDGYNFLLQPPLYPIFLALIQYIFKVDPLISSGYLNSLFLFLTVYLSGILLSRHITSFILVMCGTITVLLSFVFIQLYLKVMSEPLFITLVLLFLLFSENYLLDKNTGWIVLIAGISAFASLTRYIGIILIPCGITVILFSRLHDDRRILYHIIIFIIISSLPVITWLVRNFILSGTLTGIRAGSSYNFSMNIVFMFNSVLHWIFPVYLPIKNFIAAYTIFTFLVVGGVYFILKENRSGTNIKGLFTIIIFSCFYIALLLISSTTTAYDRIADRLLSPVFVPLVVIIFFILDKLYLKLLKYFNRNIVYLLLTVVFLFWLIYPAGKTLYLVKDYIKNSGWGYNGDRWNNSQTIQYLLNHRSEFRKDISIYSNAPEAVYILTGMETKWSPARTMYNSLEIINTSSSINEIWAYENQICLIWFNKIHHKFLFNLDELRAVTNMKEVKKLDDGSIYFFHPNQH